MKANLGQLLQAVDTLDQASAKAPLNRQDHLATPNWTPPRSPPNSSAKSNCPPTALPTNHVSIYQNQIASGKVHARSDDGYFVYDTGSGTPAVLGKIKARPLARIEPAAKGGWQLNWDEATAADRVLTSSDLKQWTDIGVVAPPMLIMPAERQFYRIQQ